MSIPSQNDHHYSRLHQIRAWSRFFLLWIWLLQGHHLAGADILYRQELPPVPVLFAIPATVGRELIPLYLDTGSTINLLDKRLKYHAQGPGRAADVAGPGGEVGIEVFEGPAIAVGDWHIPKSPVTFTDMSRFRNSEGPDILGLLGFEALKPNTLWFDFSRAELRILNNFAAPPSEFNAIDLDRSDSGSVENSITVKINERSVSLAIDSANNRAIGLKHEHFLYMSDWGYLERKDDAPSTEASFSAEKSGVATEWRFTQGNLFGMPLKGVRVYDSGAVSLIGLEILVNFDVILDTKRGVLYYKRRKSLPPINPARALGAIIAFPRGLPIVAALRPGGGPAERAGIRQGDQLIRVGTIKAANLNHLNIYNLCEKHGGETIEVEIMRDKQGEPTLKHLTIEGGQWAFPVENSLLP